MMWLRNGYLAASKNVMVTTAIIIIKKEISANNDEQILDQLDTNCKYLYRFKLWIRVHGKC